ncbi:hypothetical protein LTR85_007178 [Meristemomyces frigidus]|nr:hypothetical protein LTR85_007178 [Meristemomyces frigidus]
MPTQYLLTGLTGGLGAKVLADMLNKHHIPASNIIATSRSEGNKARFESQGLQFRVADYSRPGTLVAAFANVKNLLFVSSSERDDTKRNTQHTNVIEAAKATGVKKVWYVSLAFGGFGNGSKIGHQQAHYQTERMLQAEFPSSKSILLPQLAPPDTEGKIAFASRDELGEGIATLLAKGLEAFPSVKPQTEKNIVLLTGPRAESLVDLTSAANRGRGTSVPIQYLEPKEWIQACANDDGGGKRRGWYEARLVFLQGICNGDAQTVDPALETLLGRRPQTGAEAVERMARAETVYTKHRS